MGSFDLELCDAVTLKEEGSWSLSDALDNLRWSQY